MTNEEKQLLLEDLCARLPYGVKCQFEDTIRVTDGESGPFYDYVLSTRDIDLFINHKNFYIKPYLRPMSSMTEEERKDLLVTIVGNEGVKYFQVLSDGSIDNTDAAHQDLHNFTMHWINFDKDTVTLYLDWLNKNMFDYRNLIPKGLAVEAPDEMYGKEEL